MSDEFLDALEAKTAKPAASNIFHSTQTDGIFKASPKNKATYAHAVMDKIADAMLIDGRKSEPGVWVVSEEIWEAFVGLLTPNDELLTPNYTTGLISTLTWRGRRIIPDQYQLLGELPVGLLSLDPINRIALKMFISSGPR